MVTPAAILTRISRVHSHIASASFLRFAGQFAEKLRPRCIMNAFGKTAVMGYAVDMQVLHTDDPEPINDLTALLMREVVTAKGYPLVYTGNSLAVLAAFRRPLCSTILMCPMPEAYSLPCSSILNPDCG